MINFDLILKYLPYFWHGTLITLEIAIISGIIGISLGTFLGVLQSSKNKFLQVSIDFYATVLRGTPMLIQIALFYYGIIPQLGIQVSALTAAIIATSINSSAYVSQIVRSGIKSVSYGQIEAAKALGFSQIQVIWYIVLPQAFRVILPALGNELITLIKDSSLASTIGVMELFAEGKNIISQTYDALSVYVAIAAIYLALTSTLAIIVNKLEKKLSYHVKN